jgi:hypothetical protein
VHLEGLLAIDIGLQTGRDPASEAPKTCEALQLGVVGHSRPPSELATQHYRNLLAIVLHPVADGRTTRFGERGFLRVYFCGNQWSIENIGRPLQLGNTLGIAVSARLATGTNRRNVDLMARENHDWMGTPDAAISFLQSRKGWTSGHRTN